MESHLDHEFIVRISGGDLRAVYQDVSFKKGSSNEEIIITSTPTAGLTIEVRSHFIDLVNAVKKKSASCAEFHGDEFDQCFARNISDDIAKIQQDAVTFREHRDLLANRLRDYTCNDDELETSPAIRSIKFQTQGVVYAADILYELSNAKIWTVEDFVSDEECNIMTDYGRPRLVTATVFGPGGSAIASTSRKAQQARYDVVESPDEPLLQLKRKVLGLTTLFTGYDLGLPGQEDFTIIQYNKDDQYVTHCDGACDGSKYNPGGRVASALLYCQVAEKGGGTTFIKADVFVKPKKNQAVFFSYKGVDGVMDSGYTEHSGCPVREGEKWLTTLWMREGVTADIGWTRYDPFGIRNAR